MRQLIKQHGSSMVTLPKNGLERDGLVDEDGEPVEQQSAVVDRLGKRCYLVRLADGDVPEVTETEVVKRLAAQRMLDGGFEARAGD